mgnify:CR=1 FL=1
MTHVVNKHVLPVYDEPMIFYPVNTLIESGVDDIMVISTPEDIGRYIQLLEDEFDADFSYRVQKEPGGIAHALRLAEDFVDESVAVMLGDNIVLEDLSGVFDSFERDETSAKIFLKEVSEASRYGIAELSEGEVTALKEKPDDPESNSAIIGLYLYTEEVFDVIPKLDPSDRGEYEITDVNDWFLEEGELSYEMIDSRWFDVGTPEGMFRASEYIRSRRDRESDV